MVGLCAGRAGVRGVLRDRPAACEHLAPRACCDHAAALGGLPRAGSGEAGGRAGGRWNLAVLRGRAVLHVEHRGPGVSAAVRVSLAVCRRVRVDHRARAAGGLADSDVAACADRVDRARSAAWRVCPRWLQLVRHGAAADRCALLRRARRDDRGVWRFVSLRCFGGRGGGCGRMVWCAARVGGNRRERPCGHVVPVGSAAAVSRDAGHIV